MEADAEVKAMGAVAGALAPLDPDAVGRVLRWAAEKFTVTLASGTDRKKTGRANPIHSESSGEYQDLANFYDAANPSMQSEKALVVGHWIQVHEGQEDFDSMRVNTELKNLGHGVPNITAAFDDLIDRTPRLVMQVRKSGSSRQARKKYKLTREGMNRVNKMLQGITEEEK